VKITTFPIFAFYQIQSTDKTLFEVFKDTTQSLVKMNLFYLRTWCKTKDIF